MSKFNPNDFKAPHNPVVDSLYEYEPGKLGVLLLDGQVEKMVHSIGSHSRLFPKDILCEYENGKLGSRSVDGTVKDLSLRIGDSSTFIPKGLKWYESYVDGQIQLTRDFWEILGYDSESDFREDVRNESSTGWVERQLISKMPERWHEKIRRYFN